MISRECELCGKPFQVKYPSNPKRYCPDPCRAIAGGAQRKGQERAGVGNVVLVKRGNPKHAHIYSWWVNGDGAQSLAQQLLPYLVLKRPQAELGIEFQERLKTPALKADRTWQQEYRERMQAMNKRGREEPTWLPEGPDFPGPAYIQVVDTHIAIDGKPLKSGDTATVNFEIPAPE